MRFEGDLDGPDGLVVGMTDGFLKVFTGRNVGFSIGPVDGLRKRFLVGDGVGYWTDVGWCDGRL